MRDELQEKIFSAFPYLYIDKNKPDTESLLCYGLGPDEWFDIIYELSGKLEAEILQLPEAERYKYKAFQIKNKFGMLRFYMAGPETDIMTKLIHEAEIKVEKLEEKQNVK